MGILSRERDGELVGSGPSLAARAAAGLVAPAAPALVREALHGAGLDGGSRVVALEAGLGVGAAPALDARPRSWTGVDGDPLAVAHLRRAAAGPGRRAVHAAPEATGLPDACASIVVIDCALATRDDDAAVALLAEAVRLLATSGRLVAIEPAPGRPGVDLEALRVAGVRPRGPRELRALAAGAGLVPVGTVDGPLRLRAPHELARAAGPRTAMALAREAVDERVRHAATTVRQALEEAAPRLRAVALVAERPLVLGLRRPR